MMFLVMGVLEVVIGLNINGVQLRRQLLHTLMIKEAAH